MKTGVGNSVQIAKKYPKYLETISKFSKYLQRFKICEKVSWYLYLSLPQDRAFDQFLQMPGVCLFLVTPENISQPMFSADSVLFLVYRFSEAKVAEICINYLKKESLGIFFEKSKVQKRKWLQKNAVTEIRETKSGLFIFKY